MSCNLKIGKTKLTTALSKAIGTNATLINTYVSFISENDNYKPKFVAELKKATGLDIENIPNNKTKDVVQFIREYFNRDNFDPNFSTTFNDKNVNASVYGYTSINAREEAITHAVNFGVDIDRQLRLIENTNLDKVVEEEFEKRKRIITKEEFLAREIANRIRVEIMDRLEQLGISNQQVLLAFRNNNTTQLEKWFGEDISKQDSNLLATYNDILANRKGFFDKVFRNSKISKLLGKPSDNEDINYASVESQETIDDLENDLSDDDDKNHTIAQHGEHLGDVKSFLQHCDDDVKSYFNSLKKMHSGNTSTNNYDYNKDNELGIADTMSAEQCVGILFSRGNFTNMNTMIASIKDIANNVPGFASFYKVADDLVKDKNLDLAFKIKRDFSRWICNKKETIVDNNGAYVRNTNNTTNIRTALRFEYIDAIRGTSTSLNHELSQESHNKLAEQLGKLERNLKNVDKVYPNESPQRTEYLNKIEQQRLQLVADLAKQLQRYYPTLEDTAIANYIANANNKNKYDNIATLLTILNSSISNAKEIYNNYRSQRAQIGKVQSELNYLQYFIDDNFAAMDDWILKNDKYKTKEQREADEAKRAKLTKQDAIKQKATLNDELAQLKSKDYIDRKTKAAAIQLANEFVKFAPVKVNFNSRNVEGNLSSDVLNNNFISNLIGILKDDLSTQNYGKYKFQSRQYDFSNILVEHKEKDTIINYGLFRINPETNQYEATEYAPMLLQTSLFNGATDMANYDNVLYSKMSKGDYIATQFINYFKTIEEETNNTHGIEFANYFMKTPSDAPKNFLITAPKYSIRGDKNGKYSALFSIADPEGFANEINRRVNEIPILDRQEFNDKYNAEKPIERTLKQAINDATANRIGTITIWGKNKVNEENAKQGDTVTVTFQYKNDNGQTDKYVLSGKLDLGTNGWVLKSPKFIGFASQTRTNEFSNSLNKHFRTQMLRNGEVERKVNPEHHIFKQYKQIFLQELTDAANALDIFFENANGFVGLNPNTEMPVFKKGFANDKDTANSLYQLYHVGKGKTIFDEVNGKAKLTGAVFKSDKFTLVQIADRDMTYQGKHYKKGDVYKRNFGQELLDDKNIFNFLYGGVRDSNNNLDLEASTFIQTDKTVTNNEGVTAKLNKKQNKAVNTMITEYINAKVKDAQERLEKHEQFIQPDLFTGENIAEFILNYNIAYTSFCDIFEGDTKFYKDTQTILKRAKEVQGSGIPMATLDYQQDLTGEIQHVNSSLDKITFTKINEDGTREEVKFELFDRFKGVTIKNTIRTGDTIGQFEYDEDGEIKLDEDGIPIMIKEGALTKRLVQILKESKDKDGKKEFTAKEAERKAKLIMKGYADTTVNDAQSYITFEEWVRRITNRGQFQQYKPLIEAILDESKPVDAKTIGAFVQVQKNFYYDQHFNKRLRTTAPRQIKNAEFVLIPRFIKGTQLEQVYQLMKEKGIDQLNTEETSKAGKANVLTLWDNEGNLTQENIDKFKRKIATPGSEAIEVYSYNYLYTQQETPQHVDSENKAGIQFMKKILDNIDEGSELWKYKEEFNKLYVQNIKESSQNLINELGVKNENGKVKLDNFNNIEGLDFKVFLDMLKQEIIRRGLDSNMMDYVTLADPTMNNTSIGGAKVNTKMPTYDSRVSVTFENLAQAIFNNRITRQKLPGFHAAQITNVGFDLREDLKTNIENVQYGSNVRKLRYHPDGQGYVEIMLPPSALGLKRTKADGTLKTDKELEEELKYLEKQGLDMVVGYRIPTESKHSMCVMKVIGFTDDSQGSTIVVPDDWVAQTGSDFDIDSVYGINYKSKTNKEGKLEKITYDDNKTPAENSKDARNNRILDNVIKILEHNASLEENLSQSGFKKLIDAKKRIINKNAQARRDARSSLDVLDQADFMEDAMSGVKLKAFSVTRDTFASICNNVKPTISEEYAIPCIYRKVDGYSKSQLEKAFDNVVEIQDGVWQVIHNTLGWSKNNRNVIGDYITDYTAQTTAHILDAIKEGAIPNENDFTFQVFKTFSDVGSDFDTAVAFIMQPGVNRIVEAYDANKSIYSRDNSKPIHAALKQVANELLIEDGKEELDEYANINDVITALTPYSLQVAKIFGAAKKDFKVKLNNIEAGKLVIARNRLEERIEETGLFDTSSPVGRKNALLFDIGTILQYNKLSNLGNAIGDLCRVTNPDKFGAKQSIFATEDVFESIKDILINEEKSPVFYIEKTRTEEEVQELRMKLIDGKINEDDVPNDLSKYKIHFLQAIYPGFTKDTTVDRFLNTEDKSDKSSYPSLYAFLKYSTALSIKINKQLFDTQNKAFTDEIKNIKNVFSGNTQRLSEKLYKDYVNYTLNYLYTHTNAVANPVSKITNGVFEFEAGSNTEEERRRIFGYGKQPDLRVPVLDKNLNDTGDTEEFTVKDINHPTEREIKQYSTFSPAQKVEWLKRNSAYPRIFGYLKPNLFNAGQYRRNKVGSQTIQFMDNTDNIESIYVEFERAFENSNPLISLAALDIIKYSYMVEGFKMSQNAVNKVIKNDALLKDTEDGGTGIINNLNQSIKQVNEASLPFKTIQNDFIRSNSGMKEISTYKVKKVNKVYQLQPNVGDGMIHLNLDDAKQKNLADRYGVIFSVGSEGGFGVNKYVKLTYDKDTRLYRIREGLSSSGNREVIMYPLNLLENNEHGTWSVNPSNNRWLSEDYYTNIVDTYFKDVKYKTANESDLKKIIESRKELRKQSRYINPNLLKKSSYASSFDINAKNTKDSGGFQEAIDAVRKHNETFSLNDLYISNLALSHYIHNTGEDNGSTQDIDGKLYDITKVNYQDLKNAGENPYAKELLEKINNGSQIYGTLFLVKEHVQQNIKENNVEVIPNDEMESTAFELGRAIRLDVERTANVEQNPAYRQVVDSWNAKDITTADPSIEANLGDIIIGGASVITKTANKLKHKLEYFYDDGVNKYSVDAPETIDYIRNNPEKRIEYLQLLCQARGLVHKYEPLIALHIDAEPVNLHENLTKIKTAIEELRDATVIKRAEEAFIKQYLQKLSNHPLIQRDYLTLMDGFHSATAFDAWINDLQETSSPLLQIISKEVMGDIRAKEMLGEQAAIRFENKAKEIIDRAKQANQRVNMDNIFDKDGDFIKDYNPAFKEELDRLRSEKNAAKITRNKSLDDYLKYLDAQFAFDKFLLNHTQQKAIDEYYNRKLQLEETMLGRINPTTGQREGGYRQIYGKYNQLQERKNQILSYIDNNTLSQDLQDELKDINKQISNLMSNSYWSQAANSYLLKPSYSNPNSPFRTEEEKALLSIEPANALTNYVKKMSELKNDYFDYSPKFGFEEELKRNLEIMQKAERRVRGRITTPQYELMNNPEYLKAKAWVDANTIYTVKPELKEKVDEAFEALRDRGNGASVLSKIARNRDAYDNSGTIDGRKLTEEDINTLREEQLKRNNIRNNQPFSDRILISSSPTDDTVFTAEFYKKMKSDGMTNPEYLAIISNPEHTGINDILRKHYDPATGTVHTSELTEDEINNLIPLYEKLEDVRKNVGATNGASVYRYMQTQVDFIVDEAKYREQKVKAQLKGDRYYELWSKLNERIENDNGNDVVVPNRRIYGYAVPKGYKPDGSGNNDMVDTRMTDAVRFLKEHTQKVTTSYYDDKLTEMSAKPVNEFNDWYDKNHVFNPYTHRMEPLACWTTTEYIETDNAGNFVDGGVYLPAFGQRGQEVKEEFKNSLYRGGSYVNNFKKGGSAISSFNDGKANSFINDNIHQNEYEKEMSDLYYNTIDNLATTSRAKKFLEQGHMISRTKRKDIDKKFLREEMLKFVGWINQNNSDERWNTDVRYDNDYEMDMPFIQQLKSKESVKVEYNPPVKEDNETDEQYAQRFKEYEDNKRNAEAKNLEIHRQLLDRDWLNVMKDYIVKASHFNAVQDNKYMLFFAKNMIDKAEIYYQQFGSSNLKKDDANSTDTSVRYVTKRDDNLNKQFDNWVRRLVYDQWKEHTGWGTKTANILQSFNSAKFMMMNITGGIANVTVGEVNILGEILANEYFGANRKTGVKNWALGKAEWTRGVASYFADMYDDKASSIQSAIIKFFNVVDFEEWQGVVHAPDLAEYIERARNILYSPQAMGEHFMQNGALFTMLHSHKLFENRDKDKNGKTSYVFMNESEYIRGAAQDAIIELLGELGQDKVREYRDFINKQLSDPNVKKEYARFRVDLDTMYALTHLDKKQIKRFNELTDKYKEERSKEYNKDDHPTLMSQLDIKDGRMSFKEGSILSTMGDEAYRVLGDFKGRVISVNKKIHGIYDRLGGGMIETQWYGGLLMQYHKHMYPGIMKRYRHQGMFNEERGTIEKGAYQSLVDYMALPLNKEKFIKQLQKDNPNLTDANIGFLKSFQNVCKNYVEFFTHFMLYYDMMPEYDKANIRRASADFLGAISAVCLAIAARCIIDDDEGLAYNLFIYEADRLASESMMYNPWGLWSEGKKLWSSPVAVQGFFGDGLTTLGLCCQYVMQGDEFDPYYTSGLNAGQNKFNVLIKRNIPVYHSVDMFTRLVRTNKYYKLSDNMLSVIPYKDIADFITD